MGRAAWVTRGRPATAVPRRRSPLWTFATRTSGAGPVASARNPEEFDPGFVVASLGRRRGGFSFGSARYLLEAAPTREEADVLRARKLAQPATQPRMSLR